MLNDNYYCPQCDFVDKIDEDGCCVYCGATTCSRKDFIESMILFLEKITEREKI